MRRADSLRLRRLLIGVLVPFLAVIFTLLVTELGMRVSDRGVRLAPHHQTFIRYHSLLGWKNAPNTTAWIGSEQGPIRKTTNFHGLRGPDYPREKPTGEYRILLLGDSYTDGYSVDQHEIVGEVLQRRLSLASARRVRVINAGMPGYSTDQELLYFRTEGKKFSPDLIVVMFYFNDVWFNSRKWNYRGHKPQFKLREGSLVLTNVPVPKPAPVPESSQPPRQPERSQKVKNWLKDHSHLYRVVRRGVRNVAWLEAWAVRLGLSDTDLAPVQAQRPGRPRVPGQFLVYERQVPKSIRSAWRLTEALIVALEEEAASIDSELLVFYVPSAATVQSDTWKGTKRKYGVREEHWDLCQVESELSRICRTRGVAMLPTIDRFVEEAERLRPVGKRLYGKEDTHWNREGHRFAAELLGEYIGIRYLGPEHE